jgi:predicted nucleotidyltransferase
MAESTARPPLVEVAKLLHKHRVEYIVIGGAAAVLLGSPLPTFDVDLCYRRTEENLQRLAIALREIHPTLRGAPPDLPFQLDAKSLALGSNFTFNTDLGPLDLLGWVEPLGGYEQLLPNADRTEITDLSVLVIGLDDLIKIKAHIRRPKDRAILIQLEEIKRMREETK